MTAVDGDDGLAEERTSLAWGRSSMSLFACGVAVLKGVPRLPDPKGRPIVGGVIVGLALVAGLVGNWEERTRRRGVAGGTGAIEGRVVRRMAIANGVVGLAAFALVALAG